MKYFKNYKVLSLISQQANRTIIFMVTFFVVSIAAVAAFGHGGKHSGEFTQLQALQKATKLYDQLVTKEKLDQSWETGLQNVTISKRKHDRNVVACL